MSSIAEVETASDEEEEAAAAGEENRRASKAIVVKLGLGFWMRRDRGLDRERRLEREG